MTMALGLLVIAAAVFAVIRQLDVRLALCLAGLVLGILAGEPMAIVQTFLATLAKEQFVVPICCAMGFAYVLRHTECDRHLVHLLLEPIRRVHVLLIPGAVLTGFLINIPLISQTSTAVAVGTVLVPLLRAGRISAATIGAALLLGCSLGGELLNPGAPELRTVSTQLGVESAACVARVFPLLMVQLVTATALFWAFGRRAENVFVEKQANVPPDREAAALQVNLLKAAVTLIPLALLFMTGPPLYWLQVPLDWLVDPGNAAEKLSFDSRKIGAAMLVGVAAAALTDRGKAGGVARAFFEGAGYAFTNIIALIVAATCFGKGVEKIGLASLLDQNVLVSPPALMATAGALPLSFAVLSGSGMAATQSLFGFFVAPAQSLGIDPIQVGAVVSIAAAAGRTMSPVAAVTLMCAALTETSPFVLARRVALPLLLGLSAVVLVGIFFATRP